MKKKEKETLRLLVVRLLKIAQQEKMVDSLEKELKLAVKIITNKRLFKILLHPKLPKEDKKALVNEALKSLSPSPLLSDLLNLLIEKELLSLLPHLPIFFEKTADLVLKRVKVEIVSSIILSKDKIRWIEEALRRSMGEGLRLEVRVDKNIIGGAIIKVGDKFIDGSIRGQLKRIREEMI